MNMYIFKNDRINVTFRMYRSQAPSAVARKSPGNAGTQIETGRSGRKRKRVCYDEKQGDEKENDDYDLNGEDKIIAKYSGNDFQSF